MRQVEEATAISNAYLSQLENDKIKQPSANMLYKLASVYKIPLHDLLAAAGIIQKGNETDTSSENKEWVNRVAFYADNLSKEQQNQVLNYIKFMKFNDKNE